MTALTNPRFRLTTEAIQDHLAERLHREHPDWVAAALAGKRDGTVELWVDFTDAEDYSSAPGEGDKFGVDLSESVCVLATVAAVEGEWCRFVVENK